MALIQKVEDGVAFLRPARLHSFLGDARDRSELADTLSELDENPQVQAVLTHLPQYFPSAAAPEPEEPEAWTAAERLSFSLESSATGLLGRIGKPVLAVMAGHMEGPDLDLELACDIRLAGMSATFCFAYAARGVLPSDGATQLLPRLVGRAWALDLLMTARVVGASEALRMGLISRVAVESELESEAATLARRIAAWAPVAVRYAKEAVCSGLEGPLGAGLRLEADLSILLQSTRDRAEGLAAFREKRTPRYEGK